MNIPIMPCAHAHWRPPTRWRPIILEQLRRAPLPAGYLISRGWQRVETSGSVLGAGTLRLNPGEFAYPNMIIACVAPNIYLLLPERPHRTPTYIRVPPA